MPVYLEVIEGPSKGQKIPLNIGKSISVGRNAAKSMVALPEDVHMSGQHFSVGLRNGHVYLCNLSKVNPTEVNGASVDSAVLKPGESFKAGLNVFSVVGPANPHDAAFRVGGWGFQVIPDGWQVKEGSGLRHTVTDPFCVNILTVEEPLPRGYDLAKYLALQVSLGQKHLKAARFSEPTPASVKGADDAFAINIHAEAEKGPVLQLQIYAVHNGIVGVITATSLESQAEVLRDAFRQVLPGLSFFQG